MWLLYFINGFNQSINGTLSAYVTSDFESHSLIPLISVVSTVMAAAVYMPLAKILNLWIVPSVSHSWPALRHWVLS